ncbi:tetratricopeptide repeat protein [Flavobacterium branchiarum]|uniref:Tetratricopeptide repeat protein n=1 Tax=Flavobacterium branchiarum TaxID=1114870 RepID=A0ABV5FSE2_9FLAO|nr:tetratricopeptide repeat protein [Flavobacterium branchiarum]MDN3674931.1 tetratricopeptide repeat protein [Flavobacterium branchiarum]
MNKFKIFSVALMATAAGAYAQDISQAKKAIDAEQFEKAKTVLQSIIKAKPTDGEAPFILGNVYLSQQVADSAKIYYLNSVAASSRANLGYIGLGQLDLDNKNIAGAQANFASATKPMKRKDVEEFIYIGKAYINSVNPDYKAAIATLNRALTIDPQNAQVLLALGDAYYGDNNQNEAYKAYRNAFQADPTLLRAKMQLGVLLKGAKSYDEAIKAFNEVIALDANYGPVYRELAETYYKWARNKPSTREANYKKAITNYEKYLTLTDYSIHSRMRHADFLILVEDYKALEKEANEMIKLDKVNPRIFRYLGYAAYENGNVDVAIKSLEDYVKNPSNKIIAKDYLYLGFAKIKKGTSADGASIDPAAFEAGLVEIRKAVAMEPLAVQDLGDLGKALFGKKLYKEAAALFEFGTKVPESSTYLDDNVYYGLSIFYDNNKANVKPDPIALQKADAAFVNVLTASPTYQEAYLYRARTNRLLENDEVMTKNYEEYVAKTTEKGAEELAKPAVKTKFIEAYNNIAASYANTDKAKAIEYFNKTLALDPTNAYATQSLNTLK